MLSGVLHLVLPRPFLGIMPRVLPSRWHEALVYASGVAEIGGAIGLLSSRIRRPAGWFVVALLVAVFPANIQMALDQPNVLTIGRLPLQVPMVWAAWRRTRTSPVTEPS